MDCRQLLVKAQREAAWLQEGEACARFGPSSGRPEGRLLMVETPSEADSATETVLRSINELQGGDDVFCKTVPFRLCCSYTFFHGE